MKTCDVCGEDLMDVDVDEMSDEVALFCPVHGKRGTRPRWIMLRTKEDADEHISDKDIEEALGWFSDKRGVPVQEFIDRLFEGRSNPYDLDSYDNPAARRILSRARRMKKEMDDYELS